MLNEGVLELFFEWVKKDGVPVLWNRDKNGVDENITAIWSDGVKDIFNQYGVKYEYSVLQVEDLNNDEVDIDFVNNYNNSLKRAFVNIMTEYGLYNKWLDFYGECYNKEFEKVVKEYSWEHWRDNHNDLFKEFKDKWRECVDVEFLRGDGIGLGNACCVECFKKEIKDKEDLYNKIYFKSPVQFVSDLRDMLENGFYNDDVFIDKDDVEMEMRGRLDKMIYKAVDVVDEYQLFFLYFIYYTENIWGKREERKLKFRDIKKRENIKNN